jgi:hypothetical protein
VYKIEYKEACYALKKVPKENKGAVQVSKVRREAHIQMYALMNGRMEGTEEQTRNRRTLRDSSLPYFFFIP